MCLDKIINRVTEPDMGVYKVWKGMKTIQNYPRFREVFQFPIYKRYRDVPRGRWIKANYAVVTGPWVYYRAGFHVYPKKPRNGYYGDSLVPCLVKGIRTIGKQDGKLVWVADWIKFPKEHKRVSTR